MCELAGKHQNVVGLSVLLPLESRRFSRVNKEHERKSRIQSYRWKYWQQFTTLCSTGKANSGFFSSLDTTQGAEYSLLRVAPCQNVPRIKDTTFMCLVVCDNDPVGIFASLGETSLWTMKTNAVFSAFPDVLENTGWNYSQNYNFTSWQMLKVIFTLQFSPFPFLCTHKTFTNIFIS